MHGLFLILSQITFITHPKAMTLHNAGIQIIKAMDSIISIASLFICFGKAFHTKIIF